MGWKLERYKPDPDRERTYRVTIHLSPGATVNDDALSFAVAGMLNNEIARGKLL